GMRKLLVNPWGLLLILCFAIGTVASLCAEVPPGPKWLETAVFYQIYPQSFSDSNGDGIGDLPGITAKLDYIQSVGCNAIWINPIYESPFGDIGYDVADFYKVAPRYGTNEDFKNLCTQRFRAGSRAEATGQVNLRYGNEPGALFYTHISDLYAPYHSKVINATVRDQSHLLDCLLNHVS